MSEKSKFDPELHLLRSVARSLEGRQRSDLESARFGLWTALEAHDTATARRWLEALRVGVETMVPEALREPARGALATIAEGLG